MVHTTAKQWTFRSQKRHMCTRISKNHNSLGCEQPLGLDVNQSPDVQDTFRPIPGLNVHTHGVALVFRWNLMHICTIGMCARKGPHGYDDRAPPELNGDGCCIHCLFSPCIVSTPPGFVNGQSGPHAHNNQHRYRLYRCF